MKKFLISLGTGILLITILSFALVKVDPWKVPANYEKMKNPVAADEASVNSGRELYYSYCRSCHGTDGKGTGKRAVKLTTAPSDFSSDKFQQQTDGALLYKVFFGHKDMPGFKKKIPGTEDIFEGSFGKTRTPGDIINYLRTFAKK